MHKKDSKKTILLSIAREAIAARLANKPTEIQSVPAEINQPQGVFVTIYAHKKELRGCIGHITPMRATLAEEVAECALAAAFEDPRFPPLTEKELETAHLEISLLGPLSPVTQTNTLDAKRFGVVVSSGFRRGLLLPDIDGVDSVEMQIDIARRKAGIAGYEQVQIQKFEVEKIRE